MSTNVPELSVIIPTYNRCADLKRLLDALCLQTYPLEQLEVLVVADGCTDGTLEMLRNYRTPLALHIVEQSNQGPGAARNRGASLAHGWLFLFLDDDLEPTPALIDAHVEAHRRRPGGVVIGPSPTAFKGSALLHLQTRAWWETVFKAMLQPGYRFSYRDLLSGNLSMNSGLFTHFNGFDTSLQVHEDYELGMRLIEAGVPFTVAPGALAYHHQKADLKGFLMRMRQEGRADVLMASRHPEFFKALPLAKAPAKLLIHILGALLAFKLLAAGDKLAASFYPILNLMERARLRSHWRYLLQILQGYWYCRGVVEELGSGQIPETFLRHAKSCLKKCRPEIEINLGDGLEAAEKQLDQERPAAARIRFGQHIIGLIHHQPGAEALRGAHLRAMLASTLAVPFLEALALEGKITTSQTIDRRRLARAIRRRTAWFGPVKAGEMWFEQYSQWNDLEQADSEK